MSNTTCAVCGEPKKPLGPGCASVGVVRGDCPSRVQGHHDGCNYLGKPGMVCTKCGQVVPGEPEPQTLVERLRGAAEIAHIIADASVAEDLAQRLRDGADEIERAHARIMELIPVWNDIEQTRSTIECTARLMGEAGHLEEQKMLHRWHVELRAALDRRPAEPAKA